MKWGKKENPVSGITNLDSVWYFTSESVSHRNQCEEGSLFQNLQVNGINQLYNLVHYVTITELLFVYLPDYITIIRKLYDTK